MADKLSAGAALPPLTLAIADALELSIPDDLTTPWTILMFYRGHW